MRTCTSTVRWALVLLALPGLLACSGSDRQLKQIQQKVLGVTATTQMVVQAWTDGDVSPTYARISFEQALQLVENQRAALGASPELLIDPRGALLSRDAEALSRTLAALTDDAKRADVAAARTHVAGVTALKNRL